MRPEIVTRTTPAQMETLFNLLGDEQGCVLHSASHNLDGLWLNVYFTNCDGDWVGSIDRDGVLESTQ